MIEELYDSINMRLEGDASFYVTDMLSAPSWDDEVFGMLVLRRRHDHVYEMWQDLHVCSFVGDVTKRPGRGNSKICSISLVRPQSVHADRRVTTALFVRTDEKSNCFKYSRCPFQ